MEVMLPWLGVLAVVALLLAGVAAVVRGRGRRLPATSLPASHLDRVRSLPRYQHLARQQVRALALGLVGTVVFGLGVALLVAQPVRATMDSGTARNRDIVLCLDVSGSMAATNHAVVASYLELAEELDGERIGLVVFDAAAVTVFPLTDDADFIHEHVSGIAQQLGQVVPGTQLDGLGTSLIGDGLASCVQRFDRVETSRSRTIVLATDNQVSGTPLFTLAQAARQARSAGIMVFGIVPADNSAAATNELGDVVRRTGGDLLLLTPDGADTTAVEQAVRAQERVGLESGPRTRLAEFALPGAATCVTGLALLLASRLVGRRRA
ncbi:hypothetical protein GCM10028820_24870 [Tessaracoccus terricola]